MQSVRNYAEAGGRVLAECGGMIYLSKGDLYELPPAEYQDIAKLPGSLEAALDALREDHEFLTEGDVFTQDLIDTWLEYKETNEVAPMRAYPHPFEYQLYYDL